MTTPTDFLRSIVSSGRKIGDHVKEFDRIFAKIKTYYVNEDIKREDELEQRREEMARLLMRQELSRNPTKVKPEAMKPNNV